MYKICTNMQKYAVTPYVFLLCIYMHVYAQNMQKICKRCKHESYMQTCKNMHSPLC